MKVIHSILWKVETEPIGTSLQINIFEKCNGIPLVRNP